MGGTEENGVQETNKTQEAGNSEPDKRQMLNEFAGNTSCHGVRNVVDSRSRVGGVLWTLCVVAMFAWLVVQFGLQLKQYQSATTLQDVQYSFTRPMAFPSVTFCNFNTLKKSVLFSMSERYNVSVDSLWEYFTLLLRNSQDKTFTNENDLRSTLENIQTVTDRILSVDGEIDVVRLLSQATFSYDDYFMNSIDNNWFRCSWNGAIHSVCDPTMFERILVNFGSCLVFNPPSATHEFVQTLEGSLKGFFATFDTKLNESTTRSTPGIRGYVSMGISVTIHPRGTLPELGSMDIVAGPGQHGNLGLKVVKQILKHTWKSPCSEDKYDSRWKYSLTICKQTCIIQMTQRTCNCVLATHYFNIGVGDDNGTACHTAEDFDCIWRKKTWTALYKDIEECVSHCKVPCEEMQYPPGIAAVTSQDPGIIDSVSPANSTLRDYIKNNAASIEIHIDSFVTKIVQHQLKTSITDIFASLGGQMGLALGASLLTVIEFLEFLFLIILRPVIYKARR